ncbi:hypothetical protein AB1K83_18000, partial [Sporosarcina sp. 179-K 3D1 HS]|uniref:hypothetical protein n=1 Tax=Sporosarcina sp. 179-K 3D1 HS TaxID=3232169 RepID=UPI00399FE561
IPNTEVKLFSADGSRGLPPVRVGRRRANKSFPMGNGFFCFFLYRSVLIGCGKRKINSMEALFVEHPMKDWEMMKIPKYERSPCLKSGFPGL